MKIIIKNTVASDSKKTIERNEAVMMKNMASNKNSYELKLTSVILNGRGAKQLEKFLGQEGIETFLDRELKSQFLKNRYNLEQGSRIHDLLDSIPLYAAFHLDIIQLEGEYEHAFHIVFVKESEESDKELSEFRIPEIRYVGRFDK